MLFRPYYMANDNMSRFVAVVGGPGLQDVTIARSETPS